MKVSLRYYKNFIGEAPEGWLDVPQLQLTLGKKILTRHNPLSDIPKSSPADHDKSGLIMYSAFEPLDLISLDVRRKSKLKCEL